MRSCNPRGYYTVGKGSERVVHPVCGRGASVGANLQRVKKAARFASKHGHKLGEPIMIPKLETFREPQHRQKRVGVQTRKSSPVERKVRQREAKLNRAKKGEAGLNLRVTDVLSRRYPGKTMMILEQAQAAYHYRNPGLDVTAEPYELSEGGYLDEALESLGLPHVRTVGS